MIRNAVQSRCNLFKVPLSYSCHLLRLQELWVQEVSQIVHCQKKCTQAEIKMKSFQSWGLKNQQSCQPESFPPSPNPHSSRKTGKDSAQGQSRAEMYNWYNQHSDNTITQMISFCTSQKERKRTPVIPNPLNWDRRTPCLMVSKGSRWMHHPTPNPSELINKYDQCYN